MANAISQDATADMKRHCMNQHTKFQRYQEKLVLTISMVATAVFGIFALQYAIPFKLTATVLFGFGAIFLSKLGLDVYRHFATDPYIATYNALNGLAFPLFARQQSGLQPEWIVQAYQLYEANQPLLNPPS